jgi:hypothetical protein
MARHATVAKMEKATEKAAIVKRTAESPSSMRWNMVV